MTDIAKLAGLPIVSPKQLNKYINMLIYGESGAGKTTLVQTASDVPEMCPIIFINLNGGTLSIQDPNMDVVNPTTWKHMLLLHKTLQKGTKYKTVIGDLWSEVQDLCMTEVKGARDVPQIQDWGRVTTKMVNLTKAFKRLEMNFLATSLTDIESDSGIKNFKPGFSNKLSYRIPASLDFCAFLEVKGKKRVLTCQKTGTVSAKGRGYKLPQRIDNPTMAMLRTAVLKKKES